MRASIILNLLVLLLLRQPCAAAENAQIKTYVLEQNHDMYGPSRVYISPLGMRAELLQKGLVIVSTGPKWMVTAFSPTLKKYSTCKTEQFRGFFVLTLTIFTGRAISETPMTKTGAVKEKDANVITYSTEQSFEDKQMAEFKKKEINGTSMKNAILRTYQVPLVPSQVDPVLSRLYGLPRLPGVPKEFIYRKVHNNLEVSFLSTGSIQPRMVARSIFEVPKDYKLTPSFEALLSQGQASVGGMNMLLDTIDRK